MEAHSTAEQKGVHLVSSIIRFTQHFTIRASDLQSESCDSLMTWFRTLSRSASIQKILKENIDSVFTLSFGAIRQQFLSLQCKGLFITYWCYLLPMVPHSLIRYRANLGQGDVDSFVSFVITHVIVHLSMKLGQNM